MKVRQVTRPSVSLTLPTSHSSHCVMPACGVMLPAGHSPHEVFDGAANFPFWHDSHSATPAVELTLPAAQCVQLVANLCEYFPA